MAPSFVITAQYTTQILNHPQVNQIKATINAAIAVYQNLFSSSGTATILFDVSTTPNIAGKLLFLNILEIVHEIKTFTF